MRSKSDAHLTGFAREGFYGECMDVLAEQRADGSWDWSITEFVMSTMAVHTKLNWRDLEAMNAGKVPLMLYLQAWATAIVLYWMETRGGHERRHWSRQASRARSWLYRDAPKPPYGGTWTNCVRKYMLALGA